MRRLLDLVRVISTRSYDRVSSCKTDLNVQASPASLCGIPFVEPTDATAMAEHSKIRTLEYGCPFKLSLYSAFQISCTCPYAATNGALWLRRHAQV